MDRIGGSGKNSISVGDGWVIIRVTVWIQEMHASVQGGKNYVSVTENIEDHKRV